MTVVIQIGGDGIKRFIAHGVGQLVLKAAVASAQKNRDIAGTQIPGGQVESPVAVEIGRHERLRETSRRPNRRWGSKVPSPLPRSTETSLELELAMARSRCPLPKSPATRASGTLPTR